MVAIKQASLLSTLPLLLAVSSQALASQESGDLVSRNEGAVYERAYDEELYERDFDDELYERDFDEELDERDFDDELDERDFDEELDERDFDDELYERDEEDLFERDEYDLYLEPRGGMLSKPKKEKPKISKPTLTGGTNPVAMKDKDLKSSKNRHSSTSMEVPIKLVTSRPRSLYARGGILSKPKKEKPKISKPTLTGGTNPVAMKDKDLKSSKNRHSSTSMEVPIKLVTSRPRSLWVRGGMLSKPKKAEKPKISKPTLTGGTNPVAMKDKDLKSSKNRHSSTSMEVPIKLVTSRPRAVLQRRGGVLSKPKKAEKPKISKPTLKHGTNPVAMKDKDLKSSNRHSSGSMEVPIKLVTSRPRSLQARGGVLSKPKKAEKPKISKPTLQGGTNPVAMKDKDLKTSNRHSATSMEVPIKLVKSRH